MRTLRIAMLLLAPGWLAGCRPPARNDVSATMLRQVPLQDTLGGRTLYLESYLWRDFMPVAPPDGRPLAAVLRIHAVKGGVPSALSADSAWIVRGAEIWAAAPVRQQDPDVAGALELVARDGPRWPADELVDVVVRVKLSGRMALLRAAGQRIRRTD